MNKIIIEDSAKFEEIITRFEDNIKKIQEVFENENNNFEKIDSKETWTGLTQNSVVEKYNALKNNYDNIINSLNTYLTFMKKALKGYEDIDNKINLKIEEYENELNIN